MGACLARGKRDCLHILRQMTGRRIARTGPVSSDSSVCSRHAGSDSVGSAKLGSAGLVRQPGRIRLTKGHGREGRPVSLQVGQNPVNLLLNPAKTGAGMTGPGKRDGVEIATPSSQLTGTRRGDHTQNKAFVHPANEWPQLPPNRQSKLAIARPM